MSDGTRHRYRERIADEAAEWFIRLQDSEVSGEDRAAFADWLSASAAHVHEYLAVAALHADFCEQPAQVSLDELLTHAAEKGASNVIEIGLPPSETTVADAGSIAAAVHSVRGAKRNASIERGPRAEHSPVQTTHRTGRNSPLRYAVLAATIAAVALGAGWWLKGDPNKASYDTAIGEQKSLALPDGSVVTMNAVSRIQIRYTQQQRDIQLVSGEALFAVAKDATRPFRVITDDSVTQAVGTRFNIRRRGSDTTVIVLEGRVKVTPAAATAAPVALNAGQRAQVDAPGTIEVSAVDAAANTAWRERRLIFESRPLKDVVAEFNLYNGSPMSIESSELGEVRVSGSFYANDPGSFALFVEEAKLARPEIRPEGIRLRPFAEATDPGSETN